MDPRPLIITVLCLLALGGVYLAGAGKPAEVVHEPKRLDPVSAPPSETLETPAPKARLPESTPLPAQAASVAPDMAVDPLVQPALEEAQQLMETIQAYRQIAQHEWKTAQTVEDRRRALAWTLIALPPWEENDEAFSTWARSVALTVSQESPRWFNWAMATACYAGPQANNPGAAFDCNQSGAWRHIVAEEPENLGAWLAVDELEEESDQALAQQMLWQSSRLETATQVLLPSLGLPERAIAHIRKNHPQVDLDEITDGTPKWGLAMTWAPFISNLGRANYLASADNHLEEGCELARQMSRHADTYDAVKLVDQMLAYAVRHEDRVDASCHRLSKLFEQAKQGRLERLRRDPEAFLDGVLEALEAGQYRELGEEPEYMNRGQNALPY